MARIRGDRPDAPSVQPIYINVPPYTATDALPFTKFANDGIALERVQDDAIRCEFNPANHHLQQFPLLVGIQILQRRSPHPDREVACM